MTLPAATLRRREGSLLSAIERHAQVSVQGLAPRCHVPVGEERGEPKPRSTDRGVAQLALRKWLTSWPLLTSGIRQAKGFKTAALRGLLINQLKGPRATLCWDDYAKVGAELVA